MEKITYRLTLDTFKGGIQKVLRGVYTGDVLSRRVAISLSASSVPCKISDEESSVSAVMYVTKPSGVTNYGNCEIVDNVVYYDIIQYDVDVEGIVEMQLKVMSDDSVLYAPVFALEVQQSKNSDTIAEQSPQFTALEAALAKAEEVYRKRLVSIELTDDLVFIAHYGDNSTYESDAIKNALAFVDDAEKARVIAENERVLAEEQRVLAELERVLAEQRRNSNYDNLWTSLNEVIKDTEELQKYVESLVEEGFITESRVLELIEEHGGGAVPDNVLVASEESAQTEPAPKVNADLFGGKPLSDFASAEDIENITNGTTQVGNAKTLDGHGAEYFAKANDLSQVIGITLSTSILEKALELANGVHNFSLNGSGYNADDLPHKQYAYGSATVFKRNTTSIAVVLWGQSGLRIAFNQYSNGTWTGWKINSTTEDLSNYLPLTGGTLNANAVINGKLNTAYSAPGFFVRKANSDEICGGIGVYSDPSDNGAGKYIFISFSDVPYDNRNGLAVGADFIQWKGADLLHTGNKPTGTYTGNGDATERRINVGGIGGVCVITGGGNTAYVSVYGAIILSGATVAALPYEKLNYGWDAGILKVAATEYINDVGVDYTWRIL